jgi:hypothetical protein
MEQWAFSQRRALVYFEKKQQLPRCWQCCFCCIRLYQCHCTSAHTNAFNDIDVVTLKDIVSQWVEKLDKFKYDDKQAKLIANVLMDICSDLQYDQTRIKVSLLLRHANYDEIISVIRKDILANKMMH